MKLKIAAFGRLRFPGYRDAADEYLKRLRPWVGQLEETELKPIEVPDKSAATRARIQKEEADLFLGLRGKGTQPRIVLLHERGKTLDTQAWAERVRRWEESGETVLIGIGGSLGFSATLLAEADETLSLGPQTLSHELARVVLLEQLYRAWSVVRGHPYHHEG